VADDLIAVAPPGQRRAVPFRGNIPAAFVALAGSIAVVAFLWYTLWLFDDSLVVSATQSSIARSIAFVLGAGVLVVPFFAVRALLDSLQARKLAAEDYRHDAFASLTKSRERIWMVVGLGLTAFVIAFLFLLMSANDGAVRQELFDWSVIWSSRTSLLKGFWLTIRIFVAAELIVLVWALIVAVVRMLPGRATAPIRILAIVYTDVFRGIPALVTIYIVVFGFSLAGVPPFDGMSPDDQTYWLIVLALVLVYGAYVSEVYRSGIESVHWSQTAAARSLGLSQWQTLRHVVIPQAVRRIIPPLMNDFVALQKDTALAFIVGMLDVMGYAALLKSQYFNLSPVVGAAICFLVITIPFTRLVDYLIARDRKRYGAQ
jgi:polar amino acid transport system permease protein